MATLGSASRILPEIRLELFDALAGAGVAWHGRLSDLDFLSRLYDLHALPSFDRRYQFSEEDIRKHMVLNRDWADDWILNDSRFNLSRVPDDVFLKFLAMTLHPRVRPDPDETAKVAQIYDRILRRAGFQVVAVPGPGGSAGGYDLRSSDEPDGAPALDVVDCAAVALDHSYVRSRVSVLRASAEATPSRTIGAAKEMVEGSCREILRRKGVRWQSNWTLGRLVKETCQILPLAPDGPQFHEARENTQILVGTLAGAVDALSNLRNNYGEGHGKDATFEELEQRHAGLAVEASSAILGFILKTWLVALDHEKKQAAPDTGSSLVPEGGGH
jgi:hypothetical protein